MSESGRLHGSSGVLKAEGGHQRVSCREHRGQTSLTRFGLTPGWVWIGLE